MGNFNTKNTIDLQLKINATKQDISQDYDLSTIEGVTKANEELILSFSNFSNKDINYIKSQLFTQIKNK